MLVYRYRSQYPLYPTVCGGSLYQVQCIRHLFSQYRYPVLSPKSKICSVPFLYDSFWKKKKDPTAELFGK